MAQFPNTRWSLVRRSGLSSDGRLAFDELARLYRPAIVAFFRGRLGVDAAEDAAQSFLAASFERTWWLRADAGLGSFRGFLLLLLRRHLGHLRAGITHADGDGGDANDVVDETPGADQQFDRRFALVLT